MQTVTITITDRAMLYCAAFAALRKAEDLEESEQQTGVDFVDADVDAEVLLAIGNKALAQVTL